MALVTGGSRGIGRACVEALIARGWDVVLTSRSDAAPALACELEAETSQRVRGHSVDVRDHDEVKRLFRETRSEFGGLDALVNNAGIFEAALLGMTRSDDLRRLLEVNVIGAFANVQVAARLMLRARRGAIVNIASISGLDGRAGQVAYATSKAAIVGMTRAAARELVPIRVNAVAPGYIETGMTAQMSSAQRADVESRIGLGRFGQAREVAAAVAFLVSEDASYITGQILRVDGGAWF